MFQTCNPSVNWLHIRIDPPQPGGTSAPARSPAMTGRSERRLNNPYEWQQDTQTSSWLASWKLLRGPGWPEQTSGWYQYTNNALYYDVMFYYFYYVLCCFSVLLSECGEVYSRLFDHKPVVRGEINYFVWEFEVVQTVLLISEPNFCNFSVKCSCTCLSFAIGLS